MDNRNAGSGPRKPARGRSRSGSGHRAEHPQERTADQRVYDGPQIPEDVDAAMLDKSARRALGSLPDKLAERVARHLVAAGRLVDSDPETAYQHAQAARARAARVAVVREACGETAYVTGRYAEALAELRAAKRLNGASYYLPMMADCERALKRPERAVKMDTPEARAGLDVDGQVELTIVVAGARRDLGQSEAALQLLEAESLHTKSRADWVARLRYAYADVLLAVGRRDDAVEWFHRTVAVDGNQMTDAHVRLTELDPGSSDDPS